MSVKTVATTAEITRISKISKLLDYLIVYLAYAYGGIMFFYLKPEPKAILFVFLSVIYVFRVPRKELKPLIKVIFFITVLFLAQNIKFGSGTFRNYLGLVIPLINAYLIYQIVGRRFFGYFINVVYFFSYISLAFWIATNLSPQFYTFTKTIAPLLGTDQSITQESFIIYAYEPARSIADLIRNNGGFWEPGVYATWLVVALALNLIETQKLFGKKNNVIIFTLLTTFSTAGYLGFFFILIFNVYLRKISRAEKLIYFFFIAFMLTVSYFNIAFLGEKLSFQIRHGFTARLDDPTSGRILSARKSIYGFSQNPITGKYLVLPKGENIDRTSRDFGLSYGIMGLLQRVGFFGFVFYLFYLFRFTRLYLLFNNIPESYAKWIFLAFLSVLFSESLYDEPVFMILIFYPMLKETKLKAGAYLRKSLKAGAVSA
jgi:hypothetical protein